MIEEEENGHRQLLGNGERAEVPSCLWLQQLQNTPLHSFLIRHAPIKFPYYKNCLRVYHALCRYCDAAFNSYKQIYSLIEIEQVNNKMEKYVIWFG